MLNRRLQILVDEERYQRLARRAEERGTSVATVVREAIDEAVPAVDARRRAAADLILAAAPMPVPDDPRDLRAELDELRAGRARWSCSTPRFSSTRLGPGIRCATLAG